jgi:hypothetical protein
MPNKVARVLYFSRSAFVLYSRTSSSSEIVADIVTIINGCDLFCHTVLYAFLGGCPANVSIYCARRPSNTAIESLSNDCHFVLRLIDGTSLSLQIMKPFLLFTKSQVFFVRPELEPPRNGLPSELILKVYDPRFLDDRIPPLTSNLPSQLWTLMSVTESAHYRREIAEGKRPDDFTMSLLYGDKEAEPYLWEEHFYRLMGIRRGCFHSRDRDPQVLWIRDFHLPREHARHPTTCYSHGIHPENTVSRY